MGGVVRVVYLLRMAEITSGSSFEPYSPGLKETEMVVLLKAVKAKMTSGNAVGGRNGLILIPNIRYLLM